jgi:hypothetical protein
MAMWEWTPNNVPYAETDVAIEESLAAHAPIGNWFAPRRQETCRDCKFAREGMAENMPNRGGRRTGRDGYRVFRTRRQEAQPHLKR